MSDLAEPGIAAAYKEAKSRGLPEGWTCSIDKRNRRKWTAPNNGRSCDSIPKAIAISVELGLLPPETEIPSGRKKKRPSSRRPASSSSKKRPSKRVRAERTANNSNSDTAAAAASLLSMVAMTGKPAAVASAAEPEPPLKNDNHALEEEDDEEDDDLDDASGSEDDGGPPPIPMDPETTLDVNVPTGGISRLEATLPRTVHWNPISPDGRKIGWKVKFEHGAGSGAWVDGRVVRYDPHTHKHKIQLGKHTKKSSYHWIWLRNEQHNLQLATRMVWAHVKGYAWWPALVMESNVEAAKQKDGYVLIEFFGTGEVSCLRDTPENIRPFSPDSIDPVVAKHRKKRNQKAFQIACDEYIMIQKTRNEAAIFYAKASVGMSNYYAPKNANANSQSGTSQAHALIGKRVQLFRSDVNYPYGDTVVGTVRQYSLQQKKWLLSFEITKQQSSPTKYAPAWFNLYGKEHAMKVLNKSAVGEATREELIPFLFGFEACVPIQASDKSKDETDNNGDLAELLSTRCRGCVEYIAAGSGTSSKQDPILTCKICSGNFHLGCVDPPLSTEQWQRMRKDGVDFTCARCTPCRSCLELDVAFGSHTHPSPPPMLSLPETEYGKASLDLCSACKYHYDAERFCPNCAHIWDDKRFDMVRRQILHSDTSSSPSAMARKRRDMIEDSASQLYFGTFEGDDDLPLNAKVDPWVFYPETTEWGYTEEEMLACDNCSVWVHAGCSGMTEEEYDVTTNGDHPIYSKEYLCRMCCRQRCRDLIEALQNEDLMTLFAQPVSVKIVPNYHDMIKEPMDLQTMREKVENEEYLNYAWVREMFELMVLNALTFNRYYTNVWREAKRFYHECLSRVFAKIGRAAPPGKYKKAILKCFAKAEEAKKNEEERVQVDESVEKKDLVAGSLAVTAVSLPKLRDSPLDQASCVPFKEVKMKAIDAFYSSWMDCCFTCGSSGASDTFLFCVDCGEAFHSFCVSAPIHSMEASSVAGWRCPNCKLDEISGEVPAEETSMLFCEMCDRGFSLVLLDPPLTSAPSGLWVCGQCVDCKECQNKADKEGISLRYWSQDPEKCFRCGGCEDFDHHYAILHGKCQVCALRLRAKDRDVAACNACNAKVHSSCDRRAEEFLNRVDSALQGDEYLCPICYKPSALAADGKTKAKERMHLSKQAWELIKGGRLDPHDNFSKSELHGKLVDEIDWAVRNGWRNEYIAIIEDALRIYRMAKSLGDPRFVIQQVLQRMHQLPPWLGHRALRFAVMVKRKEWDTKGFSSKRTHVVVATAKLASAFIDIVCRTLGINTEKDVTFYDRLVDLVKAPEDVGNFSYPFDLIRESGDSIIVDDSGAIVSATSYGEAAGVELSVEGKGSSTSSGLGRRPQASYKLASPLCGWSAEVRSPSGLTEWKDPRECCLCHLCGDDDAGLPELTPNEPQRDLPALGRLLPMSDGCWVHTSCALWSSEVWEAPDDGKIYAMEKARGRGAQLKCFGCGRSGATVGCNKSNCPFNYHFPCAKVCGAVFSSSQQVFCANHKSSALSTLEKESVEHMKALMIAPEKPKSNAEKDPSETEADLCTRVGSLVVHSLGTIEGKLDGFHSESYITPPGYVSSRIYWSARRPRSRTVYILKIDKSADGHPEFSIIPGDDPTAKITGNSAAQVYSSLIDRVKKVNYRHFSQGNEFSKLPVVRRTSKQAYGLNGPQFFGFGLNHVRRLLESSPGVEAVVAPLTPSSPQYRFCFVYGADANNSTALVTLIRDLQRKRAATEAEHASQNSTGCARTEGIQAVVKSGGSGRITRALVRSAGDDTGDTSGVKKGDEVARVDKNMVQVKYRQMKAVPIEQQLVARRSHIHGWGLFTKLDIPKYNPVVEYMGEVIRQRVADKREIEYELSGEGSCYMFRLDRQRIVDATKIGCMARFMNHSCTSNAYAKIVSVETDFGQERKIVVFASRDIAAGEEITYDYKFPVEDGSLRCSCGAPNCIGRLN